MSHAQALLRSLAARGLKAFLPALLFLMGSTIADAKLWDTNGNVAGAGGGTTPSGIWDTGITANWTTNSGGTAATSTWVAGDDAIFSAGTNATGAYTITIDSTIDLKNLTVQEGIVTISSGGTLNLSANANWDGGDGLIVESPVTLNGKTLSVSGITTLAAEVTLSNKLTVSGGGTVTLSAANTGTGGIRITGAGSQLVLGDDDALGTSGILEWDAGTISAAGGARTIGNNFAVDWGGPATFAGSNDLTFDGAVTTNGNHVMTVSGTGRLTFTNGLNQTGTGRAPKKNGTGTWAIGGTSNYTGDTDVQQGTLLVNGVHTGGGHYTVNPNTDGFVSILGGTGTIAPAAGKTLTFEGNAPVTLGILNPGDGGTSVGTLTVGSTSISTNINFKNLSRYQVDIDGATADRLTLHGNLTLTSIVSDELLFNVVNAPTAGKYTIFSYTGTKTDSGTTGFTIVNGVPTGYRLSYDNFVASDGTIDLVQRAVILPTATPTHAAIITGGTTPVTVTVKNDAQTGGDSLNQFTVTAGTNVSGAAANGGPLAAQAVSGSVGAFSFNGAAIGVNAGSVSVSSTDAGVTTPVNGNFNVTVLEHADPSLSTALVDFGDVLVGHAASAVNVDLQNAAGPHRADLVLTAVNGTGDTATLTRSGAGSGSIAAGGSLASSLGLVTSTAGSFNANYAFDVEDQNLPGALDRTTQNLAVAADVYDAASITANTATTLDDGSNVSVSNAAAAPLRATAYVDSISLDAGWTLNNLGIGGTIAPGAGTPTATVTFDDTGLLNNQTATGTLSIFLENDAALAGAADQDLGSFVWNLSYTVSGVSGNQTADLVAGADYDGLNGVSDETLGSEATLLDGSNTSGSPTTVTMSWRDRTAGEAGGFAPSLPSGSAGLASDVLELLGIDGTIFVLEMTIDDIQSPGDDVFLAWFDGGTWKLATEGNHGANTANPLFLNYQGTWQASGAGLTLGAYGRTSNSVWAVLDHNSELAALEMLDQQQAEGVPEPSAWALAALGLLGAGIVARRRRRTIVR